MKRIGTTKKMIDDDLLKSIIVAYDTTSFIDLRAKFKFIAKLTGADATLNIHRTQMTKRSHTIHQTA